MAVSQYSSSRREIFGVIATASFGFSVGAPAVAFAPAMGATWDAAMARFEAARGEEIAYDLTAWTPLYRPITNGGSRIPAHVGIEMDRLTDVRCGAEDALIATPAPDLPAVIWKIEFARQRWTDFDDWPSGWWEGVMCDLRRLAEAGGH